MARQNSTALAKEPVGHRVFDNGLHIPVTDNEPGAPKALLKANRILRERRWPAPYDRTRHEMILGDARDLQAIPSESVHLVVTSPPYFNLKAYASDAGGRQLGRIGDYEPFLDELDQAWRECARVLVPGGRILLRHRRHFNPEAGRRPTSGSAVALRYSGAQSQSRAGQPYAYSLVQNREPHERGRRRIERLLRQALSAWRDHQERS